jgi:hypothetical protein
MLNDMQRRGVIEESVSPWSSRCSHLKQEWGPPLLHGLQETKHKEKRFPTSPDG